MRTLNRNCSKSPHSREHHIHAPQREEKQRAKWGWARNKISFAVLWLKSDLFSIYQWTSVVRKWSFLTESVDKIGSGTSASVCSRHGWEQSPTNRDWTCSHPRATRREQDEETRCSQSPPSKEVLLLFPTKGRYLESPVCCHVEGVTNWETTYFTGVDLQRKPQLPLLLRCAQNKKKTNWCEDVPNTRLGQHSNVSQSPCICTWSVSHHSWKYFPVYLVFCYIPPQSKIANILRSYAEHHSQASLSKWRRWRDEQRPGWNGSHDGLSLCFCPQRGKKKGE